MARRAEAAAALDMGSRDDTMPMMRDEHVRIVDELRSGERGRPRSAATSHLGSEVTSMGEVQRLTNCTTGGPVFVDVEDGKIVRMTPIDLDDDDKGDWVIEARGRTFTPPRRTTLSPHAQAQRP